MKRAVLYPDHYCWFVLASALDVMVTMIILTLGGREVNRLADAVLSLWGLTGLTFYKFALVALVIVICERVGRERLGLGRGVSTVAVGLTCVPVVFGLAQLAVAF